MCTDDEVWAQTGYTPIYKIYDKKRHADVYSRHPLNYVPVYDCVPKRIQKQREALKRSPLRCQLEETCNGV